MIPMPVILAIVGFGGVFGAGYLLLGGSESAAKGSGRTGGRTGGAARGSKTRDKAERGERGDPLPTLTRLLAGKRSGQRLAEDLARAGFNLRTGEFLAGVIAISIGLASINAILFHHILFMFLGPVEGVFLARTTIKRRKKKRLVQFEAQLADALTLISSAIRSGYSFLQGVQLVGQEMTPPVSEEMDRVWRQAALGVSMQDSLRSMTVRVPSMDLDLVVTAVQIQLETGGNLSEILNIAATTIQERERMRREIDVLTSEGRFSAKALAITPIAIGLMMYRMAPILMQPFIESVAGKFMLAGAAVFELVGWLVMSRMANLDV